MPSTSYVNVTSDPYVNGVLYGIKWATGSFTYSFPSSADLYGNPYGAGETTNNFEAFTAAQQTAIRSVLKAFSSVANLTFTEVTETSTVHADLRYAESDSPGTAWAYYPTPNILGGDIWANNSKNYYDNPLVGTYGFLTFLHETGHAMGLKHPQDVKYSFGVMPADRDSLEYTVMSYRSYVDAPLTGYTSGSTSYPQTLMMYDIAALQLMYGANYATNGGNTAYKWDALTGQMSINGVGQGSPSGNKIFMTIWDGGGIDTYDFSNYGTGVSVNLLPGSWSTASAVQLASLGSGHYAAGNIANALLYNNNPASLIENAIGGSGIDTLTGNTANNSFTGGAGNDTLNGGTGSDIAVYSGMFANYTVVQNSDGSWSVVDLRSGSPDGTDKLWNMEYLQFSDGTRTLAASQPPPPPPTNSAPVIASGTAAGSTVEWTDNSASETANTPHSISGSLVYTDANALDLHTASFAPQGTGYVGTFSLNTAGIDTGGGGTVGWSFTVADSVIDYLGAGQTLTQRYTATIDDGHGGTVDQMITITITGTGDSINTAPVITSAVSTGSTIEWTDNSTSEASNTPHSISGSLAYTDANALDLHTASFTPQGTGYVGTFSLNMSGIDTGGGGTVGWSFNVADSAIDYLSAGQTLTQRYIATIDDGHGGTVAQTITITITGTGDSINAAPVITSAVSAGSITEWADKSANETANTPHTALGSLAYTDANALDFHTASFTPQGAGYIGTFSLNTSGIDTGSGGTVGWSFNVADNAIDYLSAGQTLTQRYTVTINDGNGGTVAQTVTITIIGAGDSTNAAPVIASSVSTGSATEWSDKSANEIANVPHTASGSLAYTDANALDLHTASFAPQGTGYVGSFSLNASGIDAGGGGTVGWSFTVADSAIDYLSAGQTLTQYYTVTIDDGKGGTVAQTVTITITGTSDPINATPVIAAAVFTGSAIEWADKSADETANTLHTTAGSIVYSDGNALDTHTASFVARGAGYLGEFSLNTANINSADKVDWSFSVSDISMDYLKAGETLTQLYDVTISDGYGASIVQTITITLTGASDSITRAARKAYRNDRHDGDDGQGPIAWHDDGNDMDDHQIPAPNTTAPDLATLLGTHDGYSEHWV